MPALPDIFATSDFRVPLLPGCSNFAPHACCTPARAPAMAAQCGTPAMGLGAVGHIHGDSGPGDRPAGLQALARLATDMATDMAANMAPDVAAGVAADAAAGRFS